MAGSNALQNLIDADCKGLGTRICDLEAVSGVSGGDGGVSGGVSGVGTPNNCVDFDVGDWSIHDECLYRIDVLESQHGKGGNIMVKVEEEISPGLFKWVTLDNECVASPPGDWVGFVIRNPDCRFAGRVCFDE